MKLRRTLSLSVNIKIHIHSKNSRVIASDSALGHVLIDLSYTTAAMYFLDLKEYNFDILE